MIYGSDRWFSREYGTAREFAAAAGWRCAPCGRKIKADSEPWTSLLPSMRPAHCACIPPLSMHDLRETLGDPAADWWLHRPHVPDLRAT